MNNIDAFKLSGLVQNGLFRMSYISQDFLMRVVAIHCFSYLSMTCPWLAYYLLFMYSTERSEKMQLFSTCN